MNMNKLITDEHKILVDAIHDSATIIHKGQMMNERIKDKVSYSIPIVCIVAILVLTFMMVISK